MPRTHKPAVASGKGDAVPGSGFLLLQSTGHTGFHVGTITAAAERDAGTPKSAPANLPFCFDEGDGAVSMAMGQAATVAPHPVATAPSPLAMTAPCSFTVGNRSYHSVEHFFQERKLTVALECAEKMLPAGPTKDHYIASLAAAIHDVRVAANPILARQRADQHCKRIEAASGDQLRESGFPDWWDGGSRRCLFALSAAYKFMFDSNDRARDYLLGTGRGKILFFHEHDRFLGLDTSWAGTNHLGAILTVIRNEYLPWRDTLADRTMSIDTSELPAEQHVAASIDASAPPPCIGDGSSVDSASKSPCETRAAVANADGQHFLPRPQGRFLVC